MKKIFILFLTVFAYLSSYAQDPQLFENDWYLQKIVIDGEEYFPPLPNPEIQSILTGFGPDGFLTSMCNDLSGPVSYTNQDFVFTEALTITLGDCGLNINNEFEHLYFGVYLDNESFPFNYTITTNGNSTLSLTIIGQNGDQAIYNNVLLSSSVFSDSSFLVYPSPAQDVMTIHKQNEIIINTIKIYDVLGRMILEESNPTNQVDISKATSGLLFLQFETNKGIFTKKVVKQ